MHLIHRRRERQLLLIYYSGLSIKAVKFQLPMEIEDMVMQYLHAESESVASMVDPDTNGNVELFNAWGQYVLRGPENVSCWTPFNTQDPASV